jgi:hypothetical protein
VYYFAQIYLPNLQNGRFPITLTAKEAANAKPASCDAGLFFLQQNLLVDCGKRPFCAKFSN